ncbi:ethylene-responsive transcription factor RAP2-4-like [Neltuma alba]|uniref:ethylene-responsive transcription factor RAP2-4-like n=1 Tax=Neltuma alba TaxID=207710 RepID=UPI0010A37BD0|nr:ethylene-responsive transcription factor RAP2-4-like [Prosopis alba]
MKLGNSERLCSAGKENSSHWNFTSTVSENDSRFNAKILQGSLALLHLLRLVLDLGKLSLLKIRINRSSLLPLLSMVRWWSGVGDHEHDLAMARTSQRKKDTAEEAALTCDNSAYKLRGDFARLNFSHLQHQGAHVLGECGNYKPLDSSVDAKLQAICESLATFQKQGNAGEPCSVGDAKPKMASDESESKSDLEDCKVENIASSSSLSDKSWAIASSPESDVSFLDFSDSKDDTFDFGLEKFPSVEIDWSAI